MFISKSDQQLIQELHDEVKALIQLGSIGQECYPKTKRTCSRLLSDFNCLWTYLYHEAVEPTNNLAERDR